MKLKNIKLFNYRCFNEAEIDFDDYITLVVGKNGAGKTAVLDAVAVSVSTFLLGIDGGASRSILKDDARYEFYNLNGTIDPQHQFPVSIESIGDCLEQQNVKWIRCLNSENGKTTIKDASKLTGLAKKAQKQIMMGDKSLVLPLISYYGTGRLYAQKKEKRNLKSLTAFKRQVGYVDCMAAESNEKLMLNWFQMQTLKSLQEQQRTGILERPQLLQTVEKAICKSFERISGAQNANLFFDLDTHRLVLEFENAEGNLGIATSILEHLAVKLPVSRLQRDLTDSTVLRNVGVPFGHIVIAIQSSLKGLRKLLLNEPAIYRDLDNCWSVVAEAIQTILRREAYPHPYEALKALTRTNQAITESSIKEFIEGLNVSEDIKKELRAITPHTYTGL